MSQIHEEILEQRRQKFTPSSLYPTIEEWAWAGFPRLKVYAEREHWRECENCEGFFFGLPASACGPCGTVDSQPLFGAVNRRVHGP